jgi:hypothetical protein
MEKKQERLKDFLEDDMFDSLLSVDKVSVDHFQSKGYKAFDNLSDDDKKHIDAGLQLCSGASFANTLYKTETLDDIHQTLKGLMMNKLPDTHFLGSLVHLVDETRKFYNHDTFDSSKDDKIWMHFSDQLSEATPKNFFKHFRHIRVKENAQQGFNKACDIFLEGKRKDLIKIFLSEDPNNSQDIVTWWSGQK